MIGFFRSFLMISSGLVSYAIAVQDSSGGTTGLDLKWAVLGLAVLWWWIGLSRAAFAASRPGVGRLFACLAIPLAGAGSVYLGFGGGLLVLGLLRILVPGL